MLAAALQLEGACCNHHSTSPLVLQALPGKLTLHAADLLKEGSFDKVVDGAHFVFHTASPFQT